MKIVIDLRMIKPFPTGVGTYLDNIAYNLFLIDDTSTYIVLHNDLGVIKRLKSKYSNLKNVSIYKVSVPPSSLLQYLKLSTVLKKLKPDLLITDIWTCPLFYRKKYFIGIHDLLFYHYPQMANFKISLFNKFILPNLLKRSNKIFTVSEFSKKDISKIMNIDINKIFVTYNAVDKTIFYKHKNEDIKEVKKKYNIKSDYFIYIGNIRPHKNLNRLIDAFKIYKDKANNNTELVLVGDFDATTGKNNTSRFLNKIKNNKYNSSIKRLGHINNEDLSILLSGAVSLIQPSLFEGFGLSPIEAMASQTTVLSSNASSLPEVIQNAGLFFDPLDIEDIASKMDTIYKNSKLREDLIKKGEGRVNYFKWNKSAKVLLENIQEEK